MRVSLKNMLQRKHGVTMGDIGADPKEYEFEPLYTPGQEPVREPAAPTPAETPAEEPVPA